MSQQQPMQRDQVNGPAPQGVTPPPKFLLWAIIGLFLLAILGSVGAVIVFRSVLVPGQQQRIIDQLPFMRVFMPPTPEGGTLPTAVPVEGGISPEDLLSAPLDELPSETPKPDAPAQVPAANQDKPTVTATLTPLPTETLAPTVTSTATTDAEDAASTNATDNSTGSLVTVSQNAAVTVPQLPVSARIFGITHNKQTWNNCGPANLTMALSYYGWTHDQSYAAQYLKPDREDKNVSPSELVKFVNERTDVRAIARMGGSVTILKKFLAAQFPILIETGYMPEGYDWIGHYQTIVAYDDLSDNIFIYDSYLGTGENGAGMAETYTDLDQNWKAFNRTFIVIYEPSRESEVRQILGNLADPKQAAESALQVAQEEARANPRDVFAWFNMGTSLTRLGRYDEAAVAYDQARREGSLPWRMTWYQFGPFEAYFNTGRYDDVMALVNVNLTNGAQYVEETYYWQGRVLEAQGDMQGARNAFNRALQHNYLYADARAALDAASA